MVWTVHKFGGTSVADAACVRRVAGIIAKQPENLGVVVSAMKGVTDDLLGLVDRAARRDGAHRAVGVREVDLPAHPQPHARARDRCRARR